MHIFAHLGAPPPSIDWNEAGSLVTRAAVDLGLPVNRAAALIGLWQACPQCVPTTSPTDSTISAPLVKPLMRDIEDRKDIACGCAPYAITPGVLATEQAKWEAGSKALPFGWGWLRFDANNAPVTVAATGPGGCPPLQKWDGTACVALPVPAPTSSSSSGSGFGVFLLGAAAIGVLAFVAGAGGKQQALDRTRAIGRQGYEFGKAQGARGVAATKKKATELTRQARIRAATALMPT